MIRDAFRFLYWNIRHYSHAILGIRCKLDPDYPPVTRFFPRLIYDTVYEYRTYGAMPLVSLLIMGIASLNEFLAWAIVIFWGVCSLERSANFRSNLAYWQQAYRESPKKNRVRTHYVEWLIRGMEECWKSGNRERALELENTAFRVQDEIVGGSHDDILCECGALQGQCEHFPNR